VTNDTYSSTGVLLSRVTTAYSDDNNSVTVTSGTGANAITKKVFTDTFGNPVLTQTFANGGTNFAFSTYDLIGNMVASRDSLGQTTTFTYDGLHRLQAQALPDGATTTFG
jgi:YD repeat-containing protein